MQSEAPTPIAKIVINLSVKLFFVHDLESCNMINLRCKKEHKIVVYSEIPLSGQVPGFLVSFLQFGAVFAIESETLWS